MSHWLPACSCTGCLQSHCCLPAVALVECSCTGCTGCLQLHWLPAVALAACSYTCCLLVATSCTDCYQLHWLSAVVLLYKNYCAGNTPNENICTPFLRFYMHTKISSCCTLTGVFFYMTCCYKVFLLVQYNHAPSMYNPHPFPIT